MPNPDFDSTPIATGGDPQHRTFAELLSIRDSFDIGEAEALDIISQVRAATRQWQEVALEFQVDSETLPFFARMFEHENSKAADALTTRRTPPAAASGIAVPARRKDQGLGMTPRGGNAGSFARNQRGESGPPKT